MKIKRNIIFNYIGQFYNILIGVVMVPYYLKYLGTEAYGLVGFLALLQSWMSLLDFGMSPTLSREVAMSDTNQQAKKINFKSLVHSLESLFLLISLVIFILVFLFSGWISEKWLKVGSIDVNVVTHCIIIMGLIVGLRFITSLYNSGLLGAEHQVWVNNINIFFNTLRSIGSVFILHYISNDVELFFKYQLAVTAIALFIFGYKFYNVLNLGRFKLFFSLTVFKPIIPFATGIAYTAGIWIVLTQSDKLFLSNILPLKEYGYFSIVIIIVNTVQQLIEPISQAIQPKMTRLISHGEINEMLTVYKKASQLMAIIMFSIVGVISAFSYEIIYFWTNNIQLAKWGKWVLFWYVIGNGVLAISGLQYMLQFAYGKIKLHVQYNTFFAIISLPIIMFTAYHYSALGVAILWFILRMVSFIIWVPIIHHKFAPGLHKKWLVEDILPIFVSSVIYLFFMKSLNLNFDSYGKLFTFITLIIIGVGMILTNCIASTEGRKLIKGYILKND